MPFTLLKRQADSAAADLHYHVRWSRHLLECLQKTTGATLFIGSSELTYNPHFPHFSFPVPGDSELGSVKEWRPAEPALLLLDSFEQDS